MRGKRVLAATDSCPEDAKRAVAILCGALWPLVLLAAFGFGVWRATCAFAISLSALWRAVRPRRASVPRAVARRRSP